MGVFSWKCCRCDKPVLNNMTEYTEYLPASNVVLFLDDSVLIGSYTGYGEVKLLDGTEVSFERAYSSNDNVRWVHQGCYRQGDKYEGFEPANPDEGQGEFYDEEQLADFSDHTPVLNVKS